MQGGRRDVDVAGEKGPNIALCMMPLKYLSAIKSLILLAEVALDYPSFKNIQS